MAILGTSLADLMRDLDNQARPFQPSLDLNAIPNFEYERDFENALRWAKGDFTYTPAFPLDKFISKHKSIRLVERNDLKDISGYIEQKAEYWEIGVNQLHSQGRKSFTIAHEIGHLLFHREYLELQNGPYEEPAILMRSSLFNKVEDQANTFASELLMPKEEFSDAWKSESEDDIKALATAFGVSIQAVRYRAYKLRITREF